MFVITGEGSAYIVGVDKLPNAQDLGIKIYPVQDDAIRITSHKNVIDSNSGKSMRGNM